jgi:uncharacterized membrane protein YfcA
MAIVLISSFAAARAQAKKNNVDFALVFKWLPWIVAGSFVSGYFSAYVPGEWLRLFFSLYLLLVAYKFLSGRKLIQLSGGFPHAALGPMLIGVGLIAGLAGIGGGTMLVPMMLWFGLSMHQSVGNSSAMGTGLALLATLGYLLGSAHLADLPAYAYGSLYLPAIAFIGVFSYLAAPVGVKLAHALPTHVLKQVFGGIMLLVAAAMLIGLMV